MVLKFARFKFGQLTMCGKYCVKKCTKHASTDELKHQLKVEYNVPCWISVVLQHVQRPVVMDLLNTVIDFSVVLIANSD